MRQVLPKNLLHNPFQNRFNDPVTRRQDDMQSYAYTAWLRERNLEQSGFKIPGCEQDMNRISNASSHAGRIFAGAFAVLVVVLVLMRVF
jgi:hypothetical protein